MHDSGAMSRVAHLYMGILPANAVIWPCIPPSLGRNDPRRSACKDRIECYEALFARQIIEQASDALRSLYSLCPVTCIPAAPARAGQAAMCTLLQNVSNDVK